MLGFVKWYSRLYHNQGSLLLGPDMLQWSEQIVVITGGVSGIGGLLANTLAIQNVTVVVLDINPIVTENCKCLADTIGWKVAHIWQITLHITSVTFRNGKRLKPCPKRLLKKYNQIFF